MFLSKRIFVQIAVPVFAALSLVACADIGDRDNPLDPHGENYWENFVDASEFNGVLEESSSSAKENSPEENQDSDSQPAMSSESRGDIVIVDKRSSSSRADIVIVGKSSDSVTGLGSCAPSSNLITKGENVTWKLTANLKGDYKAMDFAKASYAWSFSGGEPSTDATPNTSTAITYANSGDVTAKVTVTMLDGSSETITCAPLHVNGVPISCGCSASGGDMSADGGKATWIASCTTAANIVSYVWDGSDLGAEASAYPYTFEAKWKTHTPTLSVANDDNTTVTVSCPTVMSSDFASWKCGEPLVSEGRSYETVSIKGNCWTKENMAYAPATGNAMCYGGKEANCASYGLLYDYEAATAACPSGWRLPTSAEYVELQESTGEDKFTAGTWFKSEKDWEEGGTDELGFSALPGGFCYSAKSCDGIGSRGYWWTSTVAAKDTSHYTLTLNGYGSMFSATTAMNDASFVSVRCVKTK